MQTRFQLFIDKYAGYFLCALLLIFVRLAGKLLRINHSLEKPFQRIVVCKFKGLGSIVQASALLSTLRKNYPTADIRFVSSEANGVLLDFYKSELSGYWLIKDRSLLSLIASSFSTVVSLWKFRPQVYIDLEIYSNYSSLLCTLSASTNRLGYYKSDKDYRTGLYTHLMYYNIKAPLADIYLQMAGILRLSQVDRALIYPESTHEMRNTMQQKALEMGLDSQKSYIIINPNASDLRLERRWPAASFAQLIRTIRATYPEFQLVLIGNKQESSYVRTIAEAFTSDRAVVDTSGRLSLPLLIGLMDQATLVVTNDTGPLHLALALRKPTVGLFGPCSPTQYAQLETCMPVYLNVYCSPCVHEFVKPPCGGDNQCMKRIQVPVVMDAIGSLLSNEQKPQLNSSIVYSSESLPLGLINNRLV